MLCFGSPCSLLELRTWVTRTGTHARACSRPFPAQAKNLATMSVYSRERDRSLPIASAISCDHMCVREYCCSCGGDPSTHLPSCQGERYSTVPKEGTRTPRPDLWRHFASSSRHRCAWVDRCLWLAMSYGSSAIVTISSRTAVSFECTCRSTFRQSEKSHA